MTEHTTVTVAVVMGGISTEHAVSLNSGANVANTLNTASHTVLPVIIAENGLWHLPEKALSSGESFDPQELAAREPVNAAQALQKLFDHSVDVVFIALHGKGGEDGQIQGFLQTAGLPFTGSGVLGNAVCMDKILTKKILQQMGVPVIKDVVIDCSEICDTIDEALLEIINSIGFPCVAKISDQGSSHNVAIVQNGSELLTALKQLKNAGEQILVEEFIKGRELTCAVIDDLDRGRAHALPPTELRPVESEWFDYHAKYTPGATEEITPAPIDEETTGRVQELARICHTTLHCSGMSRTDMFLKDGELFVIEINTVPGLTKTSLIPQAAEAAGMNFRTFVESQIKWALRANKS